MVNHWNEEYEPCSTMLDEVLIQMISKVYRERVRVNHTRKQGEYMLSVFDKDWLLYRFYTRVDHFKGLDNPILSCIEMMVDNDLADHIHDKDYPRK